MGAVSTKQRVIKLMEILKSQTDEFNKLSIYELIKKLEAAFEIEEGENFHIEKKAVKNDLEEIKASGFSINEFIDSKSKGKIFIIIMRDCLKYMN